MPRAQEALLQSLSARSVQEATLHVDPANRGALLLYQKAGFDGGVVLEDYYSPGRPALKLTMQLRQ